MFARILVLDMDTSAVLDEIYEAALVPELWYRTLDRMAEIAGGEGTLLFATDLATSQFICSPNIAAVLQEFFDDGWAERNERGNRLVPIKEPRFLTDLDAFTAEELDRSPYYTEFLRPRGFGWCAGTTINSPTNDTIVFSIERLLRNGPVEPDALQTLDTLRPHLARAAILSARAGIERARATVIALETVGLPAAVINRSGKVVAANALLAGVAPSITIGARDQVRFANGTTQARFADALAASATAEARHAACSLPLPATAENTPAIVHVLPLRGAGRDVFSGASILVYITALASKAALPASILEALFDLTPAEARVASLIADGLAVGEAATLLGVKDDTIRVQLKSIYAKTGLHRQADLVRLMTS